MNWTVKKDVLLLRQMAGSGIFDFKSGSRERGNTWQTIAVQLNADENFGGVLTARGARDKFTLSRRSKSQNAKEEKSTGGGGREQSESEFLVEELVELRRI